MITANEASIEEQISRDGAGLYTARLVKNFRQKAGELKQSLDRGLPDEEAGRYEASVRALNTAADFIEELWEESQSDDNDDTHHF